MIDATPVPFRGRHLEALRACAVSPRGLHRNAYPSVMPLLAARGLVKELPAMGELRHRGETAWFLTDAGRALVRKTG